jgi:hypothetical protein
MNRPLVIAAVAILLAGVAGLGAYAADGSGGTWPHGKDRAAPFVGYWMGIDPLDGGDSRRGITRNADRTLAVIGRDTVFTLCDDTDRAIVRVSDARVVASRQVSDHLLITCTNDGSTVDLRVRYDVIDENVVRETVTTQEGEPVDEIIFHRVSVPAAP